MEHGVHEIANWFLSKEPMTHKKLQKMCYYAKAWGLALLDVEIFPEIAEAWVHGPVFHQLYQIYANYGWREIDFKNKPVFDFDDELSNLLERVWITYKDLSGDQLESLTHQEMPWINARGNIDPWEASKEAIDNEDMKLFYKGIYEHGQND